MMSSRGMGAINPSKMPKKKVIHRTDDPNTVDMYAAGGRVKAHPMNPENAENPENPRNPGMKAGGQTKSKVNQAGVYTKPGMRKSLFESIKSRAVQGTGAGQWSARKAQLLAKQYKARGGGYK
jgi:hypothetical protein